jgi:hypothetical protein
MADEAQGTGQAAPAQQAAQELGRTMMMDEISPFPDDKSVPDQSDDIASIFGLGEEAGPVAGQQPNSPDGATGGGASPPAGASAAEGGQGQAQPATPATSTQPGQDGTTQAPAQQQPAPAAPSPTPAAGTAPAPQVDPTVQALTAQVQALTAHIAQLQGQTGQQGAGQQTPQTGQADQLQQEFQNPLTDYRLAMPDDVASAVFNEDPGVARQGLTHVINATAREVHLRTLRHVDQLINQRLQSYGQQTADQQRQERMRNEYFGAYPQHRDPATQMIVAQEAQVMWGANPAQTWDQDAINALGQRVNARLGITSAQPLAQPQGQVLPFQQQQPQQQGQPAPRPAAQLGASPRPAGNPQDNTGDFITDVLTA